MASRCRTAELLSDLRSALTSSWRGQRTGKGMMQHSGCLSPRSGQTACRLNSQPTLWWGANTVLSAVIQSSRVAWYPLNTFMLCQTCALSSYRGAHSCSSDWLTMHRRTPLRRSGARTVAWWTCGSASETVPVLSSTGMGTPHSTGRSGYSRSMASRRLQRGSLPSKSTRRRSRTPHRYVASARRHPVLPSPYRLGTRIVINGSRASAMLCWLGQLQGWGTW